MDGVIGASSSKFSALHLNQSIEFRTSVALKINSILGAFPDFASVPPSDPACDFFFRCLVVDVIQFLIKRFEMGGVRPHDAPRTALFTLGLSVTMK